MNDAKPLDSGQKHFLNLIVKGADADGWAAVSKPIAQFFTDPKARGYMPPQLCQFESNEDGSGRARLTDEGRAVINAMAWL